MFLLLLTLGLLVFIVLVFHFYFRSFVVISINFSSMLSLLSRLWMTYFLMFWLRIPYIFSLGYHIYGLPCGFIFPFLIFLSFFLVFGPLVSFFLIYFYCTFFNVVHYLV